MDTERGEWLLGMLLHPSGEAVGETVGERHSKVTNTKRERGEGEGGGWERQR